MKLIRKTPNEGGAYPPIQEGNFTSVPEDMARWPDELDTNEFYAHNGFVNLTIEPVAVVIGQKEVTIPPETEDGEPTTEMRDIIDAADTVTGYEPNTEAWQAWKASLPPEKPVIPEPTQQERLEALEAAMLAIMGG